MGYSAWSACLAAGMLTAEERLPGFGLQESNRHEHFPCLKVRVYTKTINFLWCNLNICIRRIRLFRFSSIPVLEYRNAPYLGKILRKCVLYVIM